MEIRPIRAHEAEAFLRLLCDVFGLDFARAHRIFFSEPMFDLNRKWGLFDNDKLVSILTTVALDFGWGRAIGIAGVATLPELRGQGYASKLLDEVLRSASHRNEGPALLFAREPRIYERAGFKILDEVVRASIKRTAEKDPFEIVEYPEAQRIYNHWALQDPNRLRRDERRWGYWRWNLRVCTRLGDGYLCSEAGMIRECVYSEPVEEWPLAAGTEWLGLTSMAKRLEVPLEGPILDLYLMGRDVPGLPQLFMTDQF